MYAKDCELLTLIAEISVFAKIDLLIFAHLKYMWRSVMMSHAKLTGNEL